MDNNMDKDTGDWNNLNLLSKEEIIEYLNKNYAYSSSKPEKRSINFSLWQKKAKESKRKIDLHMQKSADIKDKTRELDNIIKKFNEEKDIEKKVEIAGEINNLKKIINQHNLNFNSLIKEAIELDNLLK